MRPTAEFNGMSEYVHIDEKWFYMTKLKEKFYLLPNERPPEHLTKSKKFIPKVMFMAVVARPRYDFKEKVASMKKLVSGY